MMFLSKAQARAGTGRFAEAGIPAWWFLPVPLIWVALFAWQAGAGGEAYLALNQDPNYSYLFNGLALATGHLPAMCDHPGTPVFVFWAAFLRAMHPFQSAGALASLVLVHPEQHIAVANWLLVFLFAGTLTAGGYRVALATGSLRAGLVFQFAPLLTIHALEALHGVRPEPVLLICGTALAALLVCQAAAPPGTEGLGKRIAWIGILLGTGIAAKAHFAPLLLPALAVLPDWRARGRLTLWIIAAFALATLPSWPALARFADYVWRTSTHAGAYGSGRAGFPGLPVYLHNLVFLVKSDKPFFAILLAASCGLFLPVNGCRRGLLAAILAAQLFSVLVIAQHPSGHYLIAPASLAGAEAAILFAAFRGMGTRTGIVVLALMVCLSGYRVYNLDQSRRLEQRAAGGRERLSELMRRDYGGAIAVPFFQCSDREFALFYGNLMAGGLFSQVLPGQLDRRVFFNLFDGKFYRGTGLIPAETLRDLNRDLLLTGTRLSPEQVRRIEHDYNLTLTDVAGGWIETAYLIRWTRAATGEASAQ